MKKLLLLATGGTIASVVSEDGLIPAIDAEKIAEYLPREKRNYLMDTQFIMNIDSTNMQPEDWQRIAETIYKNYTQYDGFVITHGTDTMAYTSAALSYMLQNLSKPVILTGSQVPITFEKTDAVRNLRDACRFACEEVGGVYIVFAGKVIQGTRAIKMRTKSYAAFESVNFPYIAEIKEEVIYSYRPNQKVEQSLSFDSSICPDVFLLKLYPGSQPEILDSVKQFYKAIVIETFGSGGLPSLGRNLLAKVKELVDAEFPVVITTQTLEEGIHLDVYEVGKRIDRNKVILTRDMNTEAIVPKLMWSLGKTNNLAEIKRLMETPIAGDISRP